MLENKNLR